uniref:Uncharacterized protein n=1 Tax=Panagrolaimus davidi TaxID=227884 RepID=A0A914Q752_9BILA
MFISAEFYEKLCPSYKKVIKEFDDCIVILQSDTTEDNDTEALQQKAFEKFCTNYLMPKEYWVLYERLSMISN